MNDRELLVRPMIHL